MEENSNKKHNKKLSKKVRRIIKQIGRAIVPINQSPALAPPQEKVRDGLRELWSETAKEELLKDLDAKHLEIVALLNIQNVQTRAKIMKDATDIIVSIISDVSQKDWPEQIKRDYIKKVELLQEKFFDRIMEGS